MNKKTRNLMALLATLFSASTTAVQIDALVIYDTYTYERFGQDVHTAVYSLEEQINDIYNNSGIHLQLRVVDVRPKEWGTRNSHTILSNMVSDQSIQTWRNELGADFVIALQDIESYCGLGYATINKNYAFNVVRPTCSVLTMAHELGHNMGLNHSRAQGNTSGVEYRYGLGYGVQNHFATIMAYPSVFNTYRFALFSNPDNTCNTRIGPLPCGVPTGQPDEAHAVLAVNNKRYHFAAHRRTEINELSEVRNIATWADTSASSTYCSHPGGGLHCYNHNRVNDGDINTALGGYYSWTNANGQQGEKWVKLTWPGMVNIDKVELYTSAGYPIREYKIQYLQPNGTYQTVVHQTNNTILHRSHYFTEIHTDNIRILGIKGPTHQSNYVRVNEIIVPRAGPSVAKCEGRLVYQWSNNKVYSFTDKSDPGSTEITSWQWAFYPGPVAPIIKTGKGPIIETFNSWPANGRLTITDNRGNTSNASCTIL